MTTEQPFDQPIDQNAPPAGVAPPRAQPMGINRLRRRTTDRVIGGVAGGLGDYLNVDPILIRVGFVGLMVFGGAGFPLYLLAWLLIPAADRQDSIAEATLRRLGGAGVAVAFVLLAGLVLMSSQILDRMGERGLPTEVFWAFGIAVIGLVLVLFRRDDRSRVGTAEVGFAPAPFAPSAPAGPVASWTAPAVPARPARERSPLGWYTIAGVLVAVAAVGVVDTASSSTLLPAQYAGAGLLALGIGLIVGAWWGRARLLILVGLVALPFAAASTFLTVPFEGGAGYRAYQPMKVAELRSEYRIATGDLVIDLSNLRATGSEPIKLAASAGIGSVLVIVPTNASVDVTGSVQAGQLSLLGREHEGTGLSDHLTEAGMASGARLVLNLEAGIGDVRVQRSNLEGN